MSFTLPTKTISEQPERLLLSARNAAHALSISTRSLWTLTNSGEIKSVRINRSVRYEIDALREYIQRNTRGGK